MSFTATFTSKGQITIPKPVRDKLGIRQGVKVDIYPTRDGIVGKLHTKSNIFAFMGDLKAKDKGESFTEIRKKAQMLSARERVKRE